MKTKLFFLINIVFLLNSTIAQNTGELWFAGQLNDGADVVKKYVLFNELQKEYTADNEAVIYIMSAKYVKPVANIRYNMEQSSTADNLLNQGRCSSQNLKINSKASYIKIDYSANIDNIRKEKYIKKLREQIGQPSFVIIYKTTPTITENILFFSTLRGKLKALLTAKGFVVKEADTSIRKDLGFYDFKDYQKIGVNSEARYVLYIDPMEISGDPVSSVKLSFNIYDNFSQAAISSKLVSISKKAEDEDLSDKIISQLCENSIVYGNSIPSGFFCNFYKNLATISNQKYYFIEYKKLTAKNITDILDVMKKEDKNLSVVSAPLIKNNFINFAVKTDNKNFETKLTAKIKSTFGIELSIVEKDFNYAIFREISQDNKDNNNQDGQNQDIDDNTAIVSYKFLDRQTLYLYPKVKYPDYEIPENLTSKMFSIKDNLGKKYLYFEVDQLDESTIMISLRNYLEFKKGRTYYIKFDKKMITAKF